jgi:hypothetical protein
MTRGQAPGQRGKGGKAVTKAVTRRWFFIDTAVFTLAFIAPDGTYASSQGVSFMADTYERTLRPEEIKDLVASLMTRR